MSGLLAVGVLQPVEAIAVGLAILFTAAAILVGCLVAEKFRTQRHHSTQIRVNQVGFHLLTHVSNRHVLLRLCSLAQLSVTPPQVGITVQVQS